MIETKHLFIRYWLTAIANLARVTKDESLLEAAERLWDSTTKRKMYVTVSLPITSHSNIEHILFAQGGLGGMSEWEGFGPDYVLPNETGLVLSCHTLIPV